MSTIAQIVTELTTVRRPPAPSPLARLFAVVHGRAADRAGPVLSTPIRAAAPALVAGAANDHTRGWSVPYRPLSSSNVAGVAYDQPAQTMLIAFQNGTAYEYANVPRGGFTAFLTAPSHGRFLHWQIKVHGKYPYRKVIS